MTVFGEFSNRSQIVRIHGEMMHIMPFAELGLLTQSRSFSFCFSFCFRISKRGHNLFGVDFSSGKTIHRMVNLHGTVDRYVGFTSECCSKEPYVNARQKISKNPLFV